MLQGIRSLAVAARKHIGIYRAARDKQRYLTESQRPADLTLQ